MTRYRAEVYDNEFNFISYGAVSAKDIRADYLTDETSTVTVPEIIDAEVGNYINVREDGSIYATGIVTNVAYDENKTTISFTDFMTLLNIDLQEDTSVFESTAVELWYYNKLTDLFSGDDTYQTLTGFTCTYTSETYISYTRTVELVDGQVPYETVNLYTLMQKLLKKYNLLFVWTVDFSAKTINLNIGELDTSDVWQLKLGLADTPDFTIDIHTIEGTYNKIKYYNVEDSTSTVTYYLHSDGTVDTDSTTDRITPVTYTEKTAQADTTVGSEKTFEQVALADAGSSMRNYDYNHQIVVTFNASSKLVDVGEIGQLYNLVTPEGVSYNTVLTGFEEVNSKYLKMVFGYVRTDLTTILKMQRRNG